MRSLLLKPYIWFFSLTLIFSVSAKGQQVENSMMEANSEPHEQCAHNQAHENLLENSPTYQQEYNALEIQIQEIAAAYKAGNLAKNDEIYTIPVVVHIIHEGEEVGTESNISDAQIYSAINALNEDYRKLPNTNGDGEGVDIGVEFCLAQVDPNGNAHSGINRVNGSGVTNYSTQGISAGSSIGAVEMDVKNLSRWPNNNYYNIWVVNEIENNNGGSGIQGYAYFPTSSPVDGTVVLYNAFGTTGNLKPYTNKNRTLTHEMGHAFALYHTFQLTTACTEINCNLQGDRVCDTPPTPMNSNCALPSCNGQQLVENYMDYTSQSCKNMFTEGQKVRMRAALENSRASLINSTTCTPPTVQLADAGITEITEPMGNLCSNLFTPIVKLKNLGSSLLTSVEIRYKIDNLQYDSYFWNGTLGPGQSTLLTLEELNSPFGVHSLSAWTINPNGSADLNSNNDISSINYNAVETPNIVQVNITQDNLGTHTTWDFKDENGVVVASGGPYSIWQNGVMVSQAVCLDDACYDFTIYDAGGNGLCCGSGTGSYEIVDISNNVLASGAEFGMQESHNICVPDNANLPIADFSASETTLCAGGSISFSNESSAATSYEWKFFGGTPFTVNGANPGSITYNTPGVYNVRLFASNTDGDDVEIKSNYITVTANSTWYADGDNDGHGNPDISLSSCEQPNGYVSNATDCDDGNGSSWNSCYDCAGVMNGSATVDNCGICDSNPANNCIQDCAGIWGGNAETDNCGVCDTNAANDCVQDCAGIWGGTAQLDNCGTCDSNSDNDCAMDCAGVWGGNAEIDNCGICDTNAANDCVQDCAGVWGGNAATDNCGVCDTNTANDCEQDCEGVWGGTAQLDNCGTCDNNSANDCDMDCAGVWGGNAEIDNCGICDTNAANDCIQDCAGVWGGAAESDNCGICDTNSANDCIQDCLGIWGGNAQLDNCGTCDSNTANDCSQDCAGVWGGNAEMDNCGVCDSNSANDCVQDCAGIWGGNALTDNCGVCDNNTSNDCVQDCAGVWGGNSYLDDCGTCDDITSNDCDPCEGLEISLLEIVYASCFGLSDGLAMINVNSGLGEYSINWSNGQSGNSITNLSQGLYTATVETESCTESFSVSISHPDVLNLTLISTSNDDCDEELTGTATIGISGGTPPYSIQWDDPQLQFSETAQNLAEGIYNVNVIDNNNCMAEMMVEIDKDSCPGEITSILAVDCENPSLNINSEISAMEISGAELYEFKFENISTSDVLISQQSSHQVLLSTVAGLIGGNTYSVSVRTSYNNVWSEFGESCLIEINTIDNSDLSQLTEEYCNVLNLHTDQTIYCNNVSGASFYEWSFSNETYNFNFAAITNGNFIALDDVEGLLGNVVYDVKIRVFKNGAYSDYGASCDIMVGSNLSMLYEEFCEAEQIPLESTIECLAIDSTEQYQWRFEDIITGERYFHYTLTQTSCNLWEVDGLESGKEYYADIRIRLAGIWADYGPRCTITIGQEAQPLTGLTEAWCNNYEINPEEDELNLKPIENATVYEVKFTDSESGMPQILNFSQPNFSLNQLGLLQDLTYEVQARTYDSVTWSEWGEVCNIAFSTTDTTAYKLNLLLYPNPASTQQLVNMHIKGDWKNLEIIICNMQGRVVYSETADIKDRENHILQLSENLNAGMYLIHIRNKYENLSKKLIIE